ncbi:yeats family-domain-containing protein [Radiomyces spectabilis]|uniref:yeats family-domain-containing protein n=1 Tax=Radiomyces spectabilis TaxID=64574 RepID=UPI00222123B1|nr:yeats family-domain-containing protein [Radiomyces spectabilis]KAI8371783.1 yeats family-domain-containing protein [Radiomyces spectabilis]
MTELGQDIKIICQNSIIKGPGAKSVDGHPWRNWKIKLVAVDKGKEKKGKLSLLLDHVDYILHPTFENPRRVATKEPYTLQEKGWGEFDMRIVLYFTNNLAHPEIMLFDLNFVQPSYSIIHRIAFNNPSPELINLLATDVAPPSNANGQPTVANKRRPSHSHVASKSLKSPIPSSPGLVKREETPGRALSPSTPSYHTGNTSVQYPSTFSASPPPPSFTSPDGIMSTSPTEFQNSITPLGFASDYDISIAGLSDIGDEDQHQSRRKRTKSNDKSIVDDIYSERDLNSVNPIHRMKLDSETCHAWGIPEGFDMLGLARRLSTMTPDQAEQFHAIVRQHMTNDMSVEETDSELVLDLYSLGPSLLKRLWSFTEKTIASQKHVTDHSNGHDSN